MMSDALVSRWFDVLGFDLVDTVTAGHYTPHRDRTVPCTAFVGKRRKPA